MSHPQFLLTFEHFCSLVYEYNKKFHRFLIFLHNITENEQLSVACQKKVETFEQKHNKK